MPPKFDPNEIKVIYLRAVGGEPASSATLAPKVGPLGLNPKKVGDDIQKATKDFKGLKVTCKLTIQNRVATVELVPTASTLIIQALKEPPRDRKKEKNIKHNGNVAFSVILDIARKLRAKSMAKEFVGTVKEILGSCVSVGCTVDSKDPRDVQKAIDAGEISVPQK
ncbi:60S large subunit ribosomal protein uL11 (rpL12) [Andalucia godoyi]|uniref:60S large subunit ribosomal protein uL11 (RpL12) n=1 Tax=Andalucia godoyi TaxID=505711 RepID=A0A8K0AHR2_ANDGO|nr:60S large subunit ribosomal protein uL11 (rpL12) [Andalucia godoyi]|eukprot:ANDGO_04243.mRNA.1 60S large subunit ribosomal protein uL11 (rpL12)